MSLLIFSSFFLKISILFSVVCCTFSIYSCKLWSSNSFILTSFFLVKACCISFLTLYLNRLPWAFVPPWFSTRIPWPWALESWVRAPTWRRPNGYSRSTSSDRWRRCLEWWFHCSCFRWRPFGPRWCFLRTPAFAICKIKDRLRYLRDLDDALLESDLHLDVHQTLLKTFRQTLHFHALHLKRVTDRVELGKEKLHVRQNSMSLYFRQLQILFKDKLVIKLSDYCLFLILVIYSLELHT